MKCATNAAKVLFEDAGIPDTGWRARWRIFRAAYPAKKRSTHADRGEAAMQALNPDDEMLGRMLAELVVHKRSERWRDPAFIPHMASWINGKYWEHDRAQYRPPALTQGDRCPECGLTWRAHLTHPSRDGQRQNAQGSYCPLREGNDG